MGNSRTTSPEEEEQKEGEGGRGRGGVSITIRERSSVDVTFVLGTMRTGETGDRSGNCSTIESTGFVALFLGRDSTTRSTGRSFLRSTGTVIFCSYSPLFLSFVHSTCCRWKEFQVGLVSIIFQDNFGHVSMKCCCFQLQDEIEGSSPTCNPAKIRVKIFTLSLVRCSL